MSRRSIDARWKRNLMLVAPISLLGVWACFNAPVEKPTPKVTQESDVRVEQNIKNKVDILFMIDNSPSMAPKQNELKARFPELIKIIDDFGKGNPAHYHIGVVTSDLGSGPFTLGGGQCHPGGNGGKLQALGAGADPMCQAPTGGLNFIDYNQLVKDANGVPASNLPPGQDLSTTFGCISSVGDKGCGFEHQLESVYRAIHDKPAENHDFIRDDALLVIVFVTDEDDCSADPNSDLFDPGKTGAYGALLSYRCTQYSISCGSPTALMTYMDSGGQLMSCHSASSTEGQKLFTIDRYTNYFARPAGVGGVKVDPNDVILVGITAPETPVSSILANPNPQPPGPYVQCPGPIDGKTCAVVLQHSCVAPQNTQFFGDPAVRLRAVINSTKNNQSTSICDTSYQSALQSLGALIVSNIGAGCITSPLAEPCKPDCVVEDITANQDGTSTITELPWCGNMNELASPPCWQLQTKADKCAAVQLPASSPPPTLTCPNFANAAAMQQFGIAINRGPGGMPPPNTNARVACSTIAIPKM